MKILLTVEELAKYLKIKPDTIYKKVRKGELPAIKLGKLVRFPKELIDEWIMVQATKTMKDVQAARKLVEARMEVAVTEARKAAKVATKVMGEVPEAFEHLKKAPLNKKQDVLKKELIHLWEDLNTGLNIKARRARPSRATKRVLKTAHKANGKGGPVRVSVTPSVSVEKPAS